MTLALRHLLFLISLSLALMACGGTRPADDATSTPDLISSDATLEKEQPPATCPSCIPIANIPLLTSTTFPFDCVDTSNVAWGNKPDEQNQCTINQFLHLRESHRASRNNETRDDGSATRYPYYPLTHVYLNDSANSPYWRVYTECAVDEIIETYNGGLTYNGTTYHTGEDWNFSAGGGGADDTDEHAYAIADGVVIRKVNSTGPASFGNTIQIVHKVCPNHDPNHADCEFVISSYSHLSPTDWNLAPGIQTSVKRGDIIGRVGTTGTEGVHLHLEIRRSTYLQRVNAMGTADASGAYLLPQSSLSWPGADVTTIRKTFYDPTEFIKRHAGILLYQKHYHTGALPEQKIVLPKAGILVVDLTYPLGAGPGNTLTTLNQYDLYNVGATRYTLRVRNDDADKSLRLSGNTRQLNQRHGDQRVVIWGERDKPTAAGWVFYVDTVVAENAGDTANTPYHVGITLYPYDTNNLPAHHPVVSRAYLFDSTDMRNGQTAAQWYEPYVQSIYDLGAAGGYGSAGSGCPDIIGEFCPGNQISRMEFFQILMSAINASYHSNYTIPKTIDTNAWYYQAVITAWDWDILTTANLNEIDANGDGTLGSGNEELSKPLTRREAARYIARAFQFYQGFGGKMTLNTKTNPFPDIPSSDADYYHILGCYYSSTSNSPAGVIAGYAADRNDQCHKGDFCPNETILRGEMAKMIAKAIEVRLDSYMP